jgi:Cu(I)/Ag(I) efflux system membrane fusion protein
MKRFLSLLLLLALGVTAGWLARPHFASSTPSAAPGERKVAFYQSPMHPWIKSDKPGKCTICGMDLTPVYEGDRGFDTEAGLVTLPASSVQVTGIASTTVERAPIVRALRVAGTIDDDATRHRLLTAWAGGRIDKLFVNYVGAEVREGQPLARIYSPALLSAAREYRVLARKGEAGGDLLTSARRRLERLGLTTAQIDALPSATEDTASIEILAPQSGTVVSRDVYEGQYVEEGARLFEIGDFSTMWFMFDAYERDLPWLAIGQEVEVTVRARPGRSWKAPITFIDPNLNESTRSAKVRVDLPNPLLERGGRLERELFHRLYAEGRVTLASPPVLSVPRSAVLHAGPQAVVFVDRGGNAYERRAVKLGRVGDDRAEVLDGLAIGDRVVTEGNLLLDAQAELMRDPSSSAAAHDPPKETDTAHAPQAPAPLLALATDLAAALAADDLAAYNTAAHRSHEVTPESEKALGADPKLEPFAARLRAVGHLAEADNLTAARKAFHAFNTAVVDLALAAPPAEGGFRVFECPMTADSFPGAPPSGRWIQREPAARNPYFGKAMLECGTEVRR